MAKMNELLRAEVGICCYGGKSNRKQFNVLVYIHVGLRTLRTKQHLFGTIKRHMIDNDSCTSFSLDDF